MGGRSRVLWTTDLIVGRKMKFPATLLPTHGDHRPFHVTQTRDQQAALISEYWVNRRTTRQRYVMSIVPLSI